MSEDKLEKQIKQYAELAKQDKKIDVATLMIQALQKQHANQLSEKQKRWAYLISLFAPPLGLVFAIKFALSDKEDAKQAAWVCVALTVFAILLLIVFSKLLFSSSGVSLDQIQQINPKDIQDLVQ